MYVCVKCGKHWNDNDADQNEYCCTRKCGGTLTPKESEPELCGDLIDRVPFPIAYPWSKSLNASLHPVQRLNNLIFTAYQAMRLTGLLLLSDYLESDGNCLSLGRPLSKMRMPHWGEWKTLTDSLARYIAGRNDKYKPLSTPVFLKLAEAWMGLGKAWEKDARFALFAEGKKPPPPMEIFQNLRNDRAHRQGVQDEQGNEAEVLEKHLPLLQFTLEELSGSHAPKLFRLPITDSAGVETIRSTLMDPLADKIPLISLHGVHEDFHFEVEELNLGDSLREVLLKSSLAARLEGRCLPIYPFFLALDREAHGSGGLIEPVTMVDAFSEKKVVHLGVRSNGPVEGLGRKVVELLGRKQHQLGLSRDMANRWLMVEWARDNALSTVQNMTMNKYFPQCYVERAADRHLLAASRRRGRGIVVGGEAGSGKSSLLCRFVENLVQSSLAAEDDQTRLKHFMQKVKDKDITKESSLDAFMTLKGGGDLVIFLSGRNGVPAESGESMERAFCRALLRACGVRESEFNTPLDFLKRLDENVTAAEGSDRRDTDQERKVWIILDAINEVDRFRDLARYLDYFIHETSRYPWIRVICSARTGALDAFVQEAGTRNIQGPVPFSDEMVLQVFTNAYPTGPKEEPRLVIPSFTAKETEKAYVLRQTRLPLRAALNRYQSLNPLTKQLLSAPLYLHVFHETWKGREADLGGMTGEHTLFEAYLNSLSCELPGIEKTLESIGDYFYERETSIWPEEEAWRLTDEWIRENHFDSVLQVCSLTPVETLVSASLLMRPTDDEERGYQFSHQKICEQVLKRKIAAVWATVPKSREAIEEFFCRWLQKGERFEWLANAGASLMAEWLHGGDAEFLPWLLEMEEGVETALKTVCRSVLHEMCDMETLGNVPLDFIRSAYQPGNRYEPFMTSLWTVNTLAMKTGKTKGTFEILKSALPWHEELVLREPERTDFRRDLSVSFNNVGNIFKAMGDAKKALEYFEKSLQIMEELVLREPERTDFRRDLSVSFNNEGNIFKAMGDAKKALEYFEKSLQVREELVLREPERTDFRRDLSVSFNNVGNIFKAMGDAKKALEYFEKDLQAMEELVLREPERTDLHVDLGISYWNAYRVCPRDEEVKWLRKAKKLLEPLRSAGMVHGQIERLWQLVVDALEMRKTQ